MTPTPFRALWVLALLAGCTAPIRSYRPMVAPASRLVRFNSGMHAFYCEAQAAPLVAVRASLSVGSLQDPPGLDGLSLLTQELMLRSVPQGATAGLAESLEALGASSVEAFTVGNATEIAFVVHRSAAPAAVAAVAKALVDPLAGVDAASLADAKRAVIANATGLQQGHAALRQQLVPLDHPLARAEGGTPESIARIQLADLESWVKQHYVAKNISLSVVGDFELPRLNKLVVDGFSDARFVGAATEVTDAAADAIVATRAEPTVKLPTELEADVEYPTLLAGFRLPGWQTNQLTDWRYVRQLAARLTAADPERKVVRSIIGSVRSAPDLSVLALELTLSEAVTPAAARRWLENALPAALAPEHGTATARSPFSTGTANAGVGAAALIAQVGMNRLRSVAVASQLTEAELTSQHLIASRMKAVALVPRAAALSPEAATVTLPPLAPPPEAVRRRVSPRVAAASLQLRLDNGLRLTLLDHHFTMVNHVSVAMPGGALDLGGLRTAALAMAFSDYDRPWNQRVALSPLHTTVHADRTVIDFFVPHYALQQGLEQLVLALRTTHFTRDRYEAYLAQLGLKANPAEVAEIERWVQRVFTPRHAEVVVAGNFELTAVAPTAKAVLGRWSGSTEGPPPPLLARPPHTTGFIGRWVTGGTSAQVDFGCQVSKLDPEHGFEAAQLLVAGLQNRLDDLVRTRATSSTFSPRVLYQRDGVAHLELSGAVPFASHRIERVLTALKLMEKAEHWSVAEVDRARWSAARATDTWFADVGTQAHTLADWYSLGLTPHRVEALGDRLASLSVERVDEAWQSCRQSMLVVVRGREQPLRQAFENSGITPVPPPPEEESASAGLPP